MKKITVPAYQIRHHMVDVLPPARDPIIAWQMLIREYRESARECIEDFGDGSLDLKQSSRLCAELWDAQGRGEVLQEFGAMRLVETTMEIEVEDDHE